jgi:DNA-directed RNA polymerase specialized sigma24 family protein
MSAEIDPTALALPAIAHRCGEETERFFRREAQDPRYCFELFRRALYERNARATELVFRQYHGLVSGWVTRHPAFPSAGEEAQYFVNRAFEKLWVGISPDKWSRFPEIKAVLRYLQMCVHSAIIDHARSLRAVESLDAAEEAQGDHAVVADPVDSSAAVLADDERRELWRLVNARLIDERERVLIYASFALALKPREVCDQYPSLFGDVREVYRTKENVLQRLRRDPELRKLVAPPA